METRRERLPRSVRTLHWLAVALILVGYLSSEAMEEGGTVAGAWHVLAGIGLLLLALPRLGLHWWYRSQLTSAGPGAAPLAARLVQWSLLAFIFVQPLLGFLATWSEGEAVLVPFTAWSIAPPFSNGIGEWPEELHESLGNVFYAVIGLHAAAALWQQFVRRAGVLRRMLW